MYVYLRVLFVLLELVLMITKISSNDDDNNVKYVHDKDDDDKRFDIFFIFIYCVNQSCNVYPFDQ